ncbi:hypothetical protein KOI35_22735 [Actinoplanes bogorensis]|uniref:Uncharacterized protein n=1 Tax=Paractinoplanes bogorensis TaxID=1610840 RepID=A0ABS5YSJ1_9ACTN|nr:hypothetical protein [Actinoplanes bogorensis]MBU2666323.1 hypothetical protein [Actinoplanes bogorensis]
MTALIDHINDVSADAFGSLSEQDRTVRGLAGLTPVLATPTAVALGVAVGAAAFHAGYMVGIARNMAEGTHPVPK